MTLLKIGGRYVNFDLVCYVSEDEAAGIRIHFSGANSRDEILQIEGEEAVAMRKWLRLNSAEVKSPPASWRHKRAGSVATAG